LVDGIVRNTGEHNYEEGKVQAMCRVACDRFGLAGWNYSHQQCGIFAQPAGQFSGIGAEAGTVCVAGL
jgi:hypothetical protein